MAFQWSLCDSKSPQVSRTLLSILFNLYNAVVWMVSTCSLISKSSSPCTNLLVTVLSAPITIGITVTFMFHSFFSSLARSRYLSLFLFPFSGQPGWQNPLFSRFLFFWLTITRLLLLLLLLLLYGYLKQQTSEISHKKTWTWLQRVNFMRETESILKTAQNNAIQINDIKAKIDRTQV